MTSPSPALWSPVILSFNSSRSLSSFIEAIGMVVFGRLVTSADLGEAVPPAQRVV